MGFKKGNKFTEEHKTKISEALTGLKRPPFSKEHIEKLRITSTGRKHTEDTKNKMRIAHQGKPKSIEHRKKLAEYRGEKASWYGRKHTDKEKKKMSKAQLNKPRPQTTGALNGMFNVKRMGEKNINWRGGITPLYIMLRNGQLSAKWRTEVFQRDNYTCQDCRDDSGGNLEAHHIEEFTIIFHRFLQEYDQFSPIEDKETLLRLATKYEPFWKIDNGRTLCKDCHKKYRSKEYEKRISTP